MPEEEYPTYDEISEEDKKKFLIEKGYPFFALFIAGIITALYNVFVGRMLFFWIFLVFSIGAAVLGLFPLLFWNEDKRREYITSKLYNMNLEYQMKNGAVYSPEELDKMRFANDPVFRREVIARIHREEDAKYKKAVDQANNNLNHLKKQYDKRYKQIADARWEKVNRYVMVNDTEGKLVINGAECNFSNLRGANIVNQLGYRVETHEHKYTEERTEEHKDLSVGGAIAGGIVAGPIGAIAGAVLFAEKNTEVVRENKTAYRDKHIPVCNHLGVKVNLDGFETEIVFISSPVDQFSEEYKRKLNEANYLVSQLHMLSHVPMPENVLLVEQEPEMMLMYEDIAAAKKALKKAKENRPTYQIPDRYLPDPGEMYAEKEDEVIDLTSEEFEIFRSRENNERQQAR